MKREAMARRRISEAETRKGLIVISPISMQHPQLEAGF